jgi:hypothetical protein
MKKSLITTFNWFNSNDPKVEIDAVVSDILVEQATSHINEMTANGFYSGELIANIGDNNTLFKGDWLVEDITSPKALFNHLSKGMRTDLIALVRKNGVDSKHVNNCKVLDIAEYELVLAGEHIETISETHLFTPYGLQFNFCLLETELERVLEIIEEIQTLS